MASFHLENSSRGSKTRFEILGRDNIQGFRSVHIGKQVSRGRGKTLARGGKCPPLNETLIWYEIKLLCQLHSLLL